MDDYQEETIQTMQGFSFGEFKNVLHRVAKMLDVEESELQILEYRWFPVEYMDTKYRDPIIATSGVLENIPHIQRQRLQGAGVVGFGIYIHRSFLNPNLKYAIFNSRSQMGGDESYIIIPKGKIFELKRNAIKLNQIANQVTKAPILEEGLLEEVVNGTLGFLLESKKIEKYGVKIKRGIILDGEPGNGKTMLCRYIQKLCSQNGIAWGTITSADIDQAYQDKVLNMLFTRWTVTFFDDIDIGYMDRSRGNGRMACSLLTAMDGMHDSGHLVRIFTTNEVVQNLDKAFTRPGRIDKFIRINKPTEALRRKLIETWPEEIRNSIDIDQCLKLSNDFSFAELEAIRTFLVANFIIGEGVWDLNAAFDEFNERKEENKSIGLNQVEKSNKKKKKNYKREVKPKVFDFQSELSDLFVPSVGRNIQIPNSW